MKLKLLHFTFLISLIFTFTSCINDIVDNTFYCEEEGTDFGFISLTATSNDFWSYRPGQKLIFKDASGNEIEYVQTDYDSLFQRNTIQVVCGGFGLPAREVDVAFMESKSILYQSPSNDDIWVSLSSIPWQVVEDSLQITDVLSVSSRFTYFYFATDTRNTPTIPNYMQISNYEKVDTTLLGKTFTDAYYRSDFQNSGFFTKEQGLVAFYNNQTELYVLDRIE